jgi:hypothetical protein
MKPPNVVAVKLPEAVERVQYVRMILSQTHTLSIEQVSLAP